MHLVKSQERTETVIMSIFCILNIQSGLVYYIHFYINYIYTIPSRLFLKYALFYE